MDPTKRRHVYFSGQVQGVGFRYTAKRIADQFRVTGFVRNLPDGRVELNAEGESSELGRFLNRLAAVMEQYIADSETHSGEATCEFTDFEIRF
jgi:acylphosphatase